MSQGATTQKPALIAYPKQAAFGRVLPKNKIYEHSGANTRLKDLFVEQVEQVVWQYKLAPETINLPARPGVPEIQVFSIQLKSTELHEDVLRCIDGAVQFPILFELNQGQGEQAKTQVVAAYKRPSEADASRWVLSSYFTSDWMPAATARMAMPLALDMAHLYSVLLQGLMPLPARPQEALSDWIARIEQAASKGREVEKTQARLAKEKQFINANSDTLSFTNGVELTVGDATGDVTEAALRRIQIREAIKAHFDKEQALYQQGVKVLTLYFIDEVVKYRDYGAPDEKGEYARIFEEEYQLYLNEVLDLDETPYLKYLKGISADKTHSGYFSIDKKSKRLADPTVAGRGENAGLSDDVDAYDLILKDKERLLSFAEPVRFIFSHSALREGWDRLEAGA